MLTLAIVGADELQEPPVAPLLVKATGVPTQIGEVPDTVPGSGDVLIEKIAAALVVPQELVTE